MEEGDLSHSTTAVGDTFTNKAPRFRKSKVALAFGYNGIGYKGLQIQTEEGSSTIESELSEAIYRAGGISDDNHGDFAKIKWMRASRTDKGVHAACNIVSLKMRSDDPDLTTKINEQLPNGIKVFGWVPVMGSFHPQHACQSRLYEYLMPGYMIKKVLEPEKISVEEWKDQIDVNAWISKRAEQSEIDRFNAVLQHMVGTHNFHNLAARRDAFNASSNRHVIGFKVVDTIELNGRQFIQLRVHGQSFLLHQIRKMVAAAVLVMHNVLPESAFTDSSIYSRTKKYTLPLAPAAGLFLVKCSYDNYNRKVAEMDIGRVPVDADMWNSEIEDFIRIHIYPAIASKELEDLEFAEWLAFVYRIGAERWSTVLENVYDQERSKKLAERNGGRNSQRRYANDHLKKRWREDGIEVKPEKRQNLVDVEGEEQVKQGEEGDLTSKQTAL